MSEKFSLQDLKDANDAILKTDESDRPYLVKHDDETMVIGNANNTEVKKSDFKIQFRFEKDELESIPKEAKVINKRWVLIEKEFNDIFIAPKDDMKVVEACFNIYPFFAWYQEMQESKDNDVKEIEERYGAKFLDNGKTTAKDENVAKKMLKERDIVTYNYSRAVLHEYNYGNAKGNMSDGIYDFVAIVLNIDDWTKEHMSATSVLSAFIKMTEAFPEVFQETESLFGLNSIEEAMK